MSSTIPLRTVTALRPICMMVKEVSGFSYIFSMCRTLALPSLANSFSLILREATSEIFDIEKKTLMAIGQSVTKILFNISPLTVEVRSLRGKLIKL